MSTSTAALFSVSFARTPNTVTTNKTLSRPKKEDDNSSMQKTAVRISQEIETHRKEHLMDCDEYSTFASPEVASYLSDRMNVWGLEYVNGKLIAKCTPLPVQSWVTGKMQKSIMMAELQLFKRSMLEQGGEISVVLRNHHEKQPEGVVYLPREGGHEATITLVIEIGFQYSRERYFSKMLDHASTFMNAEEKPNLYLFLKIFEDPKTMEWICGMGLFDMRGNSEQLLWCVSFSSSDYDNQGDSFLAKYAREISAAIRSCSKCAHDFSGLTEVKNQTDTEKWSLPVPSLYDWKWRDLEEEANDQRELLLPVSDLAKVIEDAVRKLHHVHKS